MDLKQFIMPRELYYGENALSKIEELGDFKKAIIITGGSSMKKHGFLDQTKKHLKNAGIDYELFDGVEADPSVETVNKGKEAMLQFEPDLIIAIGGGSAIDAAKAMWIFYEHPQLTFDEIKDTSEFPSLRKKAKLLAIPSTSGTATEVTAFTVITDYDKKVKYPLANTDLVPDIAILDTNIPQTLPPHLVAHTGMDALTHAIEAYVATNRTSVTNSVAKESISGIYDDLYDSYHGSVESREKMHIHQCLAGMAFSNAGLGITHSLAHQIGVQFGISHGNSNAILLPYVMEYNSKVSSKEYAEIAKMLGLNGSTDKQLTNSLIASVRELNIILDIALSLEEHGVEEEHFLDSLDYIIENALKDGCTPTNPRKVNFEELKEVLKHAYYGERVTF